MNRFLLLVVIVQSLCWILLPPAQSAPLLSDINSLPERPNLPPPLIADDGQPITTTEQWHQRREEMKRVIENYELGHSPPPPGNVIGNDSPSQRVMDGKVTCRFVHIAFGPDHKLGFDAALLIPDGGRTSHPPFPTIIQPVFVRPLSLFLGCGSWEVMAKQYAEPLRRGYALMIFYYQQGGADQADYKQTGFFQAYPDYDWCDIAAWAWTISRCVDYLENQPFVDQSKIVVVGHSRLGKATLVAGAFDERISLTAPAGSGCGGTGAYRFNGRNRGGKEGLEDVTHNFPQWFSPRLAEFSGHVEKLPFDQHWLIALVAPRLFIAADGEDDLSCNSNALVQSCLGAKPVYEYLGVPDHLGLHFRPGPHFLTPGDWEAILDFSDQHLRKLDVKK